MPIVEKIPKREKMCQCGHKRVWHTTGMPDGRNPCLFIVGHKHPEYCRCEAFRQAARRRA